jgi:hypothetical protein
MSAYDTWKTTDPALEGPFQDGCPKCGGPVDWDSGRGYFSASCEECDWDYDNVIEPYDD